MCEQTEVRYLDGNVVWVKLGSCWWPGQVKDVDKLPEEILVSLKKRPIAAVKFFQEETFEYVRNLNQICMYNCRRKNEFIKKGLDIYRTRSREGSTVMNKFPEDVAIAERLTGGNPDILRDNAFAPEERPNYRNIFGGDKKAGSPDKKGKNIGSPGKDRINWKVRQLSSSANGRRNQPTSPSLPVLQQPRQITHPRFISEVKDDSDHVVRIRHQPTSTPSRDDQGGIPSPQYKCHLCDFTSTRLNVIVLHNKFHSADAANNGQGGGVKGMSASKSKSADGKSAGRGKGRASASTPSDRARARSRTVPASSDTPTRVYSTTEKNAPKRKLVDECGKETMNEESSVNFKQQQPKSPEKQLKTSERKSPKTPIFGKRKGSKWGGERPTKKKKNDEEIREKLLADWNDEDEEQEEKEIELIKQELSKSELANLHSSDATSQNECVADTKASCSEESVKPKETSCFDFDDAEDANLGSELEERAKKFVENRKIPRIIDDKIEAAVSKRRNIVDDMKPLNTVETFNPKVEDPIIDSSAVQVPETVKIEVGTPSIENEDIDTAFKTLLEETTMPALPDVPELPNTNVTSPALDVGSSASLPDVVLDSNNSHTALDSNSSVSTAQELESVESTGGDHDYSIKKETEVVHEKPEERKTKPLKTEVTEPQEAVGNAQTSLEDDEMELDINSMPVVMTDAIITEEPKTNKVVTVPIPLVDLIPSSTEAHLLDLNEGSASVTNITTVVSSSETPVVLSKGSPHVPSSSSAIVKAAQSAQIKTVKLQPAAVSAPNAVSSATISTISKLKGPGGATVISQKSPGGGKFVIVQASPGQGQQSRYTVGKTAQQRVTQQQIMQQAVGGGKVVILTKPQGSGQQKILTTALSPQQQRILTAGGKLQAQPQRIVTSTGAILNPRSIMAKGTKLTPISQQQMRALQGGKQTLGAKFTMQSTQAKVILPTMQKASVTQNSPVRVIGTLKPQSNTILIQTTQGTTVSGTVLGKPAAATSGQLQAKINTSQSITRLSTSKPKILTSPGISSSVQRISVPTTGGGKLVQSSQAQPKVLEIRPTVAPGMVVQKVQSPLSAKASSVGLLTNVSQVKKVSGIFPRAPSIQKIVQTTSQTQSVQKISPPQSVQRVIASSQTIKKATLQQKVSDVNIPSKQIPIVVSATNLQPIAEMPSAQALPSLQPMQPSVTVGPTIQQNLQPNTMVISTTQSSVSTAVAQGSTIHLPSLQPTSVTTTAGTSVLTPQQIAQVVAATPTEQLGDSGTATYVLVTIDDSGALQSYDNSTLLAYDGSSQTNDGAARTLYIDPSSISTSGNLENIILTIDNSASSSGTVLNLGQSNTISGNPVRSIAVENSTSSMFNIGPAPRASGTAAAPQSGGSNQDILAEALANTQVFQPDSAIQDSLTVVNSSQSTVMTPRLLEPSSLLASSPSTLRQATMLLPSLSTVLPPPNPAGVLETSLTLNQPIMTPLEVPSSAVPILQAPPPVPSSLELPLSITQPTLSVTSQPYPNISVTAPSHNPCNLSEKSTGESPVSNSTLPLTMTEPTSVSATDFNPSMPLLSEETDCHSEVDSSPVEPPNSSSSDKPQSHSDNSYIQDPKKTSRNLMQEVAGDHDGDVFSPPGAQDTARHTGLTSDPKSTSHDEENHMNESSDIQGSLHHQGSESTIQCVAPFNEKQRVPEIQSAIDQTMSSLIDPVSGNAVSNHAEILDSTPVQSNSSPKNTPEAAVADDDTSDTNHSSSGHLLSDQSSHNNSYGHVSENTSRLAGSLAASKSETPITLPSFTEIPEDTSSISDNIVHPKLEMDPPTSDETTFENNSLSSQFQLNSQATTSDECVRACYLQIPESTSSAEEKVVTNNLSEQILNSSQNTSNIKALASFHKGSEDTLDEARSEQQSEKEATFASYPAENASRNIATDAVVPLQQSISNVPHSMPLLVDEPMTETANDHTESSQRLGTESSLREDDIPVNDMEITKKMRLEQSERSKDQGSLSPKSVPCPDSHDDERADSDEELPPAFSPSNDSKKKRFMKDDIVWVRCKKAYWPAVVTNVNKKNRKAYVKHVNSPRKSKAYKIGFSSLIGFEDRERNKQLLELGKSACSDFQSAFDKVTQFYVKKHHQHKLSAARYLTFDPGDLLYGTLPDVEESENSNGIENEDECPVSEQEIESDSGSVSDDFIGYQKSRHSHSSDVEDMFPSCSTSLPQEKEEEARKLLKVIQSDACWNHLCKIYRGEVYSERHSCFMSGNLKLKSNLKYSSGITIFPTGVLELELANTLRGYIDRLGIVQNWSDYMYYVWLPEALIYAMQKTHNMSEDEAEGVFLKFSGKPA